MYLEDHGESVIACAFFFNPGPERRVPSQNRYTSEAKLCFCKNNKRMIHREIDRRQCVW